MKHQWLAKLALMIVWPPLAVMLATMMAVVLVISIFLIPFGVIKRKDDGGYTMTFPWGD